jgi:TolB protein
MRRISCLSTLTVILLVAGCSSGGGGKAAAPAATATPLPAGLAAAKGWLAYSTGGDNDRVHVSRINGSGDHEVASELAGETVRADFSHDGRLAFVHLPPNGGVGNVYVAKADGTGARVIAECQPGVCSRGFPAWSPDSKWLAVVVNFGPGDEHNPPPEVGIAVIDVATQEVRVVLRHSSKDFQDGLVRWSPDGRQLAFYRWRDNPGRQPLPEASVWVVNPDGTGLKQLTAWDLLCGDPDWSPDGSQIICATYPPANFDAGAGNIYVLRADGSDQPHALTTNGVRGPRAAQPRFTPDGRYILYVRAANPAWDAPPRHIYALEVATGQSTPVLTKGEFYTRPSLQPTQ